MTFAPVVPAVRFPPELTPASTPGQQPGEDLDHYCSVHALPGNEGDCDDHNHTGCVGWCGYRFDDGAGWSTEERPLCVVCEELDQTRPEFTSARNRHPG